MRYLRTNTAVIVTVGPFIGTDGFTLKTALTITNERITLTADTDAGSAPTLILDNIAGATSATANDLNYITGQDNAMMQMELAAADVNRFGRMRLTITDATNHLPVVEDFMVLPAVIYDAMILGTDLFDVSVTQLLGTAWLTPAVAGTPDVNAKQWAGTAIADTLYSLFGVVSVGTLDAGGNSGTKTFTIPAAQRSNVHVGDWLNPTAKLCARKIDAYNSGTGVGTVDTVWPVDIGAVAYQATLNYPGIPLVAADYADGIWDTVKFSSGFLARLLASTSVTRIDALEGTGLTITVGAGAHTTSSCLASDATNGTRVKGRAGIVTSGGIVKRGIRFTGDIAASGAFGYTDLYGNAVPAAVAENDVVVVI